MVETAWKSGGRVHSRNITPDQGVVTSLHLTDKYIVVALDNAKIHVFDATGAHQKTLHGHIMGVWAMVPWGDILVSGGCDRDVRVWNMATGLVSLTNHLDLVTDSLSLQSKPSLAERAQLYCAMFEDVELDHCYYRLTRYYIEVMGSYQGHLHRRSRWPSSKCTMSRGPWRSDCFWKLRHYRQDLEHL